MLRFLTLLTVTFFSWNSTEAQDDTLAVQAMRHASHRTVLLVTNKLTGEMDIFLKGQYVVCRLTEDEDFGYRGVIDSIGEHFISVHAHRINYGSIASITRKRDRGQDQRIDYKSKSHGVFARGNNGSVMEPHFAAAGLAVLVMGEISRAQKRKPTGTFQMKHYMFRVVTDSHEGD